MTTALHRVCPIDGGLFEPHCNPDPKGPYYSHTCDLVRCRKCRNVGTIDGQWWPWTKAKNSPEFKEILKSMQRLRKDLDERDSEGELP